MSEASIGARPTLNVIFILVTRPSIRQDGSVVNIPFRFHAGGAELESGRYLVRHYDENILRFTAIRSSETRSEAMIIGSRTDSGNGTLVFLENGNRYLLAKVLWPSAPVGKVDTPNRTIQRDTVPEPFNMLIH
jgi:hypothetical protein